MPSLTFQGFTTATAVACLAEQGANSASGYVPTWGQSGGLANLSIQILDESSRVAPAVLFFGAVPGSGFSLSTAPAGTPYEPWRHEITYIWRIRNQPLSFERGPHLNMPEDWKNANIYYGPEAAIVFDAPGTYDVDLVAVDRFGNWAQTSYENIEITDADGQFPDARTICFSLSDFNGAPSNATQVSSFAELQSALSVQSVTGIRVLFRAGDDFRGEITSQISLGAHASCALGSFGSGAKPILPLMKQAASGSAALFGIQRDGVEAKFYNLDLRGGWEADRERGWHGASPIWRDTATDCLFHRCRLSGANTLNNQNRLGDCFFVWSDGEVTNWQNFALYGFTNQGGVKRFAIVGSDLHQHEDARQGRNKSGVFNEHGPLRVEHNDNLYLHVVDVFTRNGWSTGSGGTADQPCIRINSSGAANAKTTADRCVLEGGYQILKMRGQDPNTLTPDVPGNHVFDKLLTIGSCETQWHLDCTYGGVTFRNTYAFEPNVPKYSLGVTDGMFNFDSDDSVIPENVATPVSIYSSTFVSLLSSASNQSGGGPQSNIPGVTHSGDFLNYTEENIVTYMPNQNTPDVSTVLDIATGLAGGHAGVSSVTPRFKGVGESSREFEVTGNGTATLTVPYSAIPDFDGNATSQAYWQAREAAGSTKHIVLAPGYTFLHPELNELTVTFNASHVEITRTSGVFDSGGNVVVKLDQSDLLPPLDTTYDSTGAVVPEARLTTQVDAGGEFVAPDRFIATDVFNSLGGRSGSALPGSPSGPPPAQKGAF